VAAERFPAPTRPVSDIVAPRWSAEERRDDAGEARTVLALGEVRAGTRVADIGAGDGYYVVRAAGLVGPAGRVWAQDIEADYLGLLVRRLRAEPRPNVVVALGEPHDPRLPAGSVDVALLVHMYHEITQPFGLLYNLYPALRPGARVLILDTTRPTGEHGTPPALLRCELEAMGYGLTRQVETGPGEYVAIFAPPPSAAALTPPDSVAARLASRGCAALARPGAR
jgi:ubiquinone/menaquinone biosynthesis C-methylase UbiE